MVLMKVGSNCAHFGTISQKWRVSILTRQFRILYRDTGKMKTYKTHIGDRDIL